MFQTPDYLPYISSVVWAWNLEYLDISCRHWYFAGKYFSFVHIGLVFLDSLNLVMFCMNILLLSQINFNSVHNEYDRYKKIPKNIFAPPKLSKSNGLINQTVLVCLLLLILKCTVAFSNILSLSKWLDLAWQHFQKYTCSNVTRLIYYIDSSFFHLGKWKIGEKNTFNMILKIVT